MKLNKKLMVLAAAGALTAATATSALAFENEFHGFYNLKYIVSNYETSGYGFLGLGKDPGVTVPLSNRAGSGNPAGTPLFAERQKAANFFDQRARIFYTAKASDDLKLVTGFEIDSVFGDKAQGSISTASAASGAVAFRNSGGALEADAVNLETKWVYLDFKIPSTPVRVTAGIQPIKDAFKGIFLDADIAGINTVSKFGPATVGVGYFRAYDESFMGTTTNNGGTPANTRTTRGIDDLDIVAATLDYNVNKNLKVGAAYYLYNDNRNDTDNAIVQTPMTVHVFGINADAKIGDLGLSGFAATQQGSGHSTANKAPTTVSAYAFNAAAKLPVGPGTARTAFLYTSGDDGRDNIDTSWKAVVQTQNGTVSAPANTYNESNMMLLNRSATMEGTQADVNLINSINNRNQGTIMATAGYDITITPKLFTNVNVGVAWAAKNNAQTRLSQGNGSNFLGTEVNFETGYKLYDNLTAKIQAAYMILGGYYSGVAYDATGTQTGKDPEDPYTARVMLSYVF